MKIFLLPLLMILFVLPLEICAQSDLPTIPGYEHFKTLTSEGNQNMNLHALVVTQFEKALVVYQKPSFTSRFVRVYRLPSFELIIEKQEYFSDDASKMNTFLSEDELAVYIPYATCSESAGECRFTKLNIISGLSSIVYSSDHKGKTAIASKGVDPIYIKDKTYLIIGGENAQVFVFKKKNNSPALFNPEPVVEEKTLPKNIIPDVDINIPVNAQNKKSTYALVIGNEDYTTYQPDLRKEANVPYAINDAKVFKEYLVRTIGVPERQVKLIEDGTYGQINQGIAWLNQLAMIEGGQAELILYYSGHGLPDVNTGESFIIPVDVSGSNLDQAISLDGVISSLAKNPTKRTLVFLDACFSGGGRKESLLLDKGVKIKPREVKTMGNLWLFASSSGEQPSGVFEAGKHGYFTYFLLKKLKESNGNITLEELKTDVVRNVGKETALSGALQTPSVRVSPSIKTSWNSWRLRE